MNKSTIETKCVNRRSLVTGGGIILVGSLLSGARAQTSIEDPKEVGAAGKHPPPEIQTLIDKHINGFNSHNTELFLSVFSENAIIIDGIAPYRWLNPNAPANWLADVEKWREKFEVSSEHLAYEMGFWNVEGADAYAVIAGTLSVTIKGQTVARTGTLAFTLSKPGDAWKIGAQAWGRTS
jgi:hypothetical protein